MWNSDGYFTFPRVFADEAAVRTSGNPLGLAPALRKLEYARERIPMQHGSPALAHLFIVNPFTRAGFVKLFSTHPSTEERIARLESMASQRTSVEV